MESKFVDFETIVRKAPLHLSPRIRKDFEKCKVELIRFMMRFGSGGHGETITIIGYDRKGKSYSISYPTAQFYWSDVDERS